MSAADDNPPANQPFTIKRLPEIRTLRDKISDALERADVDHQGFHDMYDDFHRQWFVKAHHLNNTGQHRAVRGKVLDWGFFLRDMIPQQQLEGLLHEVFREQWRAATKKHGAKLANAQKALELTSTIELVLEMVPEAIQNTKAVAGVSSLRVPTNHKPVPATQIRAMILSVMMESWRDGDPAPTPSTENIVNAVNALKAAAPPKAAGIEKRTRKRKSQAAQPEDDDEEPEEPRAKRRRMTIDPDIDAALGDEYVSSILNDGDATLLSALIGDDDTTGLAPGPDFATNQHDGRISQLFSELMDEEVDDETRAQRTDELREMMQQEEEEDALVREQIELSIRIQKKRAAKVKHASGSLINAAFAGLASSAAVVVEAAKRDGLLAYLESRKKERERVEGQLDDEDEQL